MKPLENHITSQAQFWVFLGPCLFLLSTSILFFKSSPDLWYLPLSALIGIPLCLKWTMKGLAVSLVTLFCLTVYSYQDLSFDDRYWHVGMGIAFALSFVILTLSAEEAQGIIGGLQAESHSRLGHVVNLDEKYRLAQKEIGELSLELAEVRSEKQMIYKVADLTKDELIMVRSEYEKLVDRLKES